MLIRTGAASPLAARAAAASLARTLRLVGARGGWARWWPGLLFAALPLLLFRAGLGSGTAPFGGDVVVLNYPLLSLIQRQMQHGLLPLWNTYAGGGAPLVPFSALVAYPPLWPLRALSINDAITVLDIAHFALAGLGAYALAGVTGAGRLARCIGALGFVCSGFLLGHLYAGHLLELGVIGWMPWVFVAMHRLIARPSARGGLLLGVVAGLQVLANGLGFLVFTLYPVTFLLAGAIALRARHDWRGSLRLAAAALLGAAIALGLAAVLVLPFAQSLGESVRANGLDFGGASKISLPPAALLMAFAPDAVGNGLQNSYWLDDFSSGYWHEFALYMGLLPILGALVAAQRCRGVPWVRFYSVLAFTGLLMAFGRYTPLYGLAFHLPALNLVRVPARWLLASTLAVSVLAAPGVEWLVAQRSGTAALLRALRAPISGAAVPAAAVLVGLQIVYVWSGAVGMPAYALNSLAAGAERVALFGGLIALVLCCNADRLIRPGAARWLLAAITLLDLWIAASGSVRFVDAGAYYRPTTLSGLLEADTRTYRVLALGSFRTMPFRQGMVSGALYNAEDYAPVTLRDYWSVTHPQAFGGAYEISNADARDLITCYDPRFASLVGIGEIAFPAPYSSRFLCPVGGAGAVHLDLRSAVATEYWMLPNGASWNPTPFLGIAYVYRNPDALPRAFLVGTSARTLAAPLQQRLAVMRADFDARRQLVLDTRTERVPLHLGWLQDLWAHALRPAPVTVPSPVTGDARVLSDSSNAVQVGINAAAPSYLVLDDTYYPGWEATVDGTAVPIRRADYLLRAVPVPAGRHLVTFVYAPLSYLCGLVISGATAALVLLCVLVPWMRRGRMRRRRSAWAR